MCQFSPSDRSRVRINKELASYDKDYVYRIIDEVPICHLSAVVDGMPYIQATVHWRIGNKIYIHGAVKNKMIHAIHQGAEACLSFSDFGGYVLTRSAFNHAVIYRSVIAFCKGRVINDLSEKRHVLETFIESIQSGRWDKIRQPEEKELKQTGVIEFELQEVSAKSLSQEAAAVALPGGEMEVEADEKFSPWTGILPYKLIETEPVHSSDSSLNAEKL